MNLTQQVFQETHRFSQEVHGSSNYDQDEFFVANDAQGEYAPLSFLVKKINAITGPEDLVKIGFVCDSYDLVGDEPFETWFEKQFAKKLKRRVAKKINILHLPDNKNIFDAIEQVNESYEVLRQSRILLNGKNLPVQLGEWYTKCIFGLQQRRSTSQRGFDFYIDDRRVEVKVHWKDQSSPKGVKLRKSLVELANYCIIIYVARNFMIREICFLDSDFVIRKFAGKGHTIFLKDSDVSPYFFSKSTKHLDKVVNSSALLKYASPTLALKIAEKFSE